MSVATAAVPECPERCHVAILDTYLSKLPPEVSEKEILMCNHLIDLHIR